MANEIRLSSSPNNTPTPTPWADLEIGNLFEGNSYLNERIYELGVESLNSSSRAEAANSTFADIPVSLLNSAETLPMAGTKRKRGEDTKEISDKSWSSVSENEVDEDQCSEILPGISTTEPSTFILQSTNSIVTPMTAPSEQLSKSDYKKCREEFKEYMNQNPACTIRSLRTHIKETMGHDVSESTLHRWRRWVQEPQKLSEIDSEKCREKAIEYMNQNPTCTISSLRAHIKETMGHDVSETSLRTWTRSAQQPQKSPEIDYKKCREKAVEYMNQNPACTIRSLRTHIKETMGHDVSETSLRIWRRSMQDPQQSSKIDYDKCKEKAAEYINQNPGCNTESVRAHIKETMGHDVSKKSLRIWRKLMPSTSNA